ncbi:hypothetical protein BGX27_004705 [Mortierella sp. AM989]|nr:hypothetical protein BGX27_004705 [Mortierella sp. AM989]
MFSITKSSLSGAVSRSATHVVKRWKSRKSIEVTLKANVSGLGKPGDIVSVAPGLMRNRLFPMSFASYIDRNAHHVREATIAGQDALKNVQEVNKVYQQTIKKEQRIIHLQELRHNLEVLPPLVFSRAVNEVLPGSRTIFGSVQAEDVAKELKEKHGITVDLKKVTVNGTKIKSIGDSWAKIDLGELGSVELKVVVERR